MVGKVFEGGVLGPLERKLSNTLMDFSVNNEEGFKI